MRAFLVIMLVYGVNTESCIHESSVVRAEGVNVVIQQARLGAWATTAIFCKDRLLISNQFAIRT